MTPAATLSELGERVARASGPDRELDARIDIAVRGFPRRAYDLRNGMRAKGSPELDPIAFMREYGASQYTQSLDDATSLAPDSCMYRSGNDGEGPDPSRFFCEAITPAPACAHVRAVANTEPLARVACFLRARVAVGGGE